MLFGEIIALYFENIRNTYIECVGKMATPMLWMVKKWETTVDFLIEY